MRNALLCILLWAALAAPAHTKDWTRDLWSKNAEKRLEAASLLAEKAKAEGLDAAEIKALAERLEDADAGVRDAAAKALAATINVSVAQELAPDFASAGDNLVAFLLWYSVYQSKNAFVDAVGRPAPGDVEEEINRAHANAAEAYANILDPARKNLGSRYYERLTP